MDNGSFIKIHRKMLDWEWYDNPITKILFLHLLLIANWKETSWHGIKLYPGEVIRTNENLATELSLSIQQVKTSLNNLKITQEITCRKVGKIRVITIKNWGAYQGSNLKSNLKTTQKPTSSQPDNNLIITADKEYKEKKEYKNNTKARSGSFNYIIQHDYDFDELERKLLGGVND